jgi:hypothetical protein
LVAFVMVLYVYDLVFFRPARRKKTTQKIKSVACVSHYDT